MKMIFSMNFICDSFGKGNLDDQLTNEKRQLGAHDRTRTCTPLGITLSTLRVYQFHHKGMLVVHGGLEPP